MGKIQKTVRLFIGSFVRWFKKPCEGFEPSQGSFLNRHSFEWNPPVLSEITSPLFEGLKQFSQWNPVGRCK